MGRYEDAIDELRDLDVDEDVIKKFEEFKGSTLRSKAEAAGALEKELADTKAELAALQAGPVRENAFKEYGIDLDALSKLEREALERIEVPEGGFTREQLADLAEQYELPMTAGAPQGDEEKTGAEQVAQHARSSQTRTTSTVIKPSDTADWPADKLRRLYDNHKPEYEALLRGETVTGLAFQ